MSKRSNRKIVAMAIWKVFAISVVLMMVLSCVAPSIAVGNLTNNVSNRSDTDSIEDIHIEAERTEICESERVLLIVTGIPTHTINIIVPTNATFPSGLEDNPPTDTIGPTIISDTIDADGKRKYVVCFNNTGIYTITVTDTIANLTDSIDIMVFKKKVAFDIPSTCIIGETLTMRGVVSAGNTIDIAINHYVRPELNDIPIDLYGCFEKDIETDWMDPGVYKIEGFIDRTAGIGNTSGEENKGYTGIFMIKIGPPDNECPVAFFNYTPQNPVVDEEITFNASASYDPDGEIVSYKWYIDYDFAGEGRTMAYSFSSKGRYVITLMVTDDDGAVSGRSAYIEIETVPVPEWRKDIEIGDILYDQYRSGEHWWTVGEHAGIYVGNGEVVEASVLHGKVINTRIGTWDYPSRRNVYLLRVIGCSDEQREEAASFAMEQIGRPYQIALWDKRPDSHIWYCSELPWAAYWHIGIDIDASDTPEMTEEEIFGNVVWPKEIKADNDTEVINSHLDPEDILMIGFLAHSPVDLVVTDPDGLTANKDSVNIPAAVYIIDDIDGDGSYDDLISIYERKMGNYLISVIPEPDAVPTDTYTLEVSTETATTILAENTSISEIPTEPYVFESTFYFDTSAPSNPYPSIFGTHNGTITPNQTITVSKLYTYPCIGTGGHSEYVRIYNESGTLAEGYWISYRGYYHNITLMPSITLLKDHEYNYTIITGSYPQIHHTDRLEIDDGVITCDNFIDANGKIYYDWIPAIRLE